MALTPEDKILLRIEDAKANHELKRYMYNMRRFVAGDDTAMGGDRMTLVSALEGAGRVVRMNREFPHFKISEHEEGISNHVLTWINNIIKQSLISRPRLEWPDLSPSVSSVREAYVLDRWGKSYWKHHQYKAIYSYLVDGIAFVKIGMKGGLPRFRYADTVDMYWDLSAETPYEHRFLAEDLRLSEDVARREFGDKIVNWLLGDNVESTEKQRRTQERVVKVVEYWDSGTRAFLRPGKLTQDSVIKRQANDQKEIPFEILSQPVLPSMLAPLPHIITVIGAQTALTQLQRSLLKTYKALRPFYTVDESCFTRQSVDEWLDTEDIACLKWAEGVDPQRKAQAISIQHVDKLPAELMTIKETIENEIVRGLGVNPYIAGAPMNPEFSREVSEISGQSQLGVSYVKDVISDFLGCCARRTCRVGADWDDEPFTVRLEGDVVEFGEDMPVQPILQRDVDCVAIAGQYETEAMKMMRAEKIMETAQLPQVVQQYPRVMEWALEFWLEAFGARDIQGLMRPPDETMLKMQLVAGIPLEVLQQILEIAGQLLGGGAGQPQQALPPGGGQEQQQMGVA